jgi:hypothetical protein
VYLKLGGFVMADKFIFRRGTGSKQKDKRILEINEENISLQNRKENALIITFKAPEEEINKIYDYFENFEELEAVTLEIAKAGEVGYYFRGTSPINGVEENMQQFSVTLQLQREFL